MLCPTAPTVMQVLIAVATDELRDEVRAAVAPYVTSEALRTAGDLAAVVGVLGERSVELLILDAGLPGFVSGTLGTLRSTGGGEDLYVVVLTQEEQLASLLATAEHCADDLLLKPLIGSELRARVRMAFGRIGGRLQRRTQARQLEDLTHRQREFLSVVSHEIRTPLSAIMSSANILRRYGRERPDTVEKFAAVIQQEGRRLARLINNLLDLAKIEADEVEWVFVPTAPGEILEQMRDSFAALAGERRLELSVVDPGGLPGVVLDRDKVIQVLTNLLSNAVKHSPEWSTVTLGCRPREGGGVVFAVEDEGPGIPPGMEDRVFERFQQLEVGDERTGTGLGLTISREIVERHGGRIWAEGGRSRGARFVVELPVAPPAEEADGPV